MRIKLLLTGIIFLLLSAGLIAQNTLVVYHTDGVVTVINGHETKLAVRGDQVSKSGVLVLTGQSDCMLISESGKSLQLNTAGRYSYDKLQVLFRAAGTTNISSKYFKYVYDNLFSKVKNDKLGVAPVVFRDEALMNSPEDSSVQISHLLFFSWKRPADKNSARIRIFNEDSLVYDKVIPSTGCTIDLARLLRKGTRYSWTAEEAGAKQHTLVFNHFIIPAAKDLPEVRGELGVIQHIHGNSFLLRQMQKDFYKKWDR